MVTAWVAFFTGHLVGNWLRWTALRVGPLNLLPALVATVLGLIAANVLAGGEHVNSARGRKRPPAGE